MIMQKLSSTSTVCKNWHTLRSHSLRNFYFSYFSPPLRRPRRLTIWCVNLNSDCISLLTPVLSSKIKKEQVYACSITTCRQDPQPAVHCRIYTGTKNKPPHSNSVIKHSTVVMISFLFRITTLYKRFQRRGTSQSRLAHVND